MANFVTNVGTAIAPNVPSSSAVVDIDPKYSVELFVNDGGSIDSMRSLSGSRIFPMLANIDEKYSLNFSSTWESPFSRASAGDVASKLLGGKVSGEDIDRILNAAGIGSRLKIQSARVWTGSSPLSFDFTMKFNAIKDTEAEIRQRHMALLKLAAPSESIGVGSARVLKAPGPTLAGGVLSDTSRRIDLRVGKYLYMKDVVVDNVASEIDCLCDANGIPISMSVAVQISSFYACFTTEDIEAMFNNGIRPQG